MSPTVPITRLPHGQDIPLPAYETAQAAGMDLRAAVAEDQPLVLHPGDRFAVPTGLAFAFLLVLLGFAATGFSVGLSVFAISTGFAGNSASCGSLSSLFLTNFCLG